MPVPPSAFTTLPLMYTHKKKTTNQTPSSFLYMMAVGHHLLCWNGQNILLISKLNETDYTTLQKTYWHHKPSAEWWKKLCYERDAMNLTFLGPLKIFLLPSLAFSWALTWGFLTVSEGKGTSGNSRGSVKPQANISHVPAKWKVH